MKLRTFKMVLLGQLFMICHQSLASEIATIQFANVNSIQRLPFPSGCTNAVDKNEYSYELDVSNLNDGDNLVLLPRGGGGSRAQKISVAKLKQGEIKLKSMTLVGGIGETWNQRGLWVEHVESGERTQLNYLPGSYRCNSDGRISATYTNLRVRSK